MAAQAQPGPTADNKPIPKSTFEPIIEDLQIEPAEPITEESTMIKSEVITDPMDSIKPPDDLPFELAVIHRNPDSSSQNSSHYNLPKDNGSNGIYQSRFCGTSGSARRICYLVDCSGSMVMAFQYVRSELHRAISQLSPVQYFQVIFFAGGTPQPLPGKNLRRATTENKDEAKQFIDRTQLKQVRTTEQAGQAVIGALEAAFAAQTDSGQSIDLIYLLTDGDYDHHLIDQTIQRLQKQHPHQVGINVIACGNQDHQDYLRRLAFLNKGQYTYLSDEDLAKQASIEP